MKTLLDLANMMDRLQNEVKTAASDAAVSVAGTILRKVVPDTPVDTSTALSGWVVSIKYPTEYRPGAHYYGQQGSTYTASVRETIATATKILALKHPGQTIWISNNEPYIDDLNAGSSKQAPAGFVDRAVAIGVNHLRDYKLKLKV